MTFQWAERLAPAEPVQAQGLQDQYSAYQASKSANGASGSFIYSPQYRAAINGQRAVSRPDIYAGGSQQYGGLQSYQAKPRDPLARKPGESIEAWRRSVLRVARHLPDDAVNAALAAIDQAQEQAAEHPSQRVEELGIMGLSPQDRAAAVGRFGGRQIEQNGGAAVEPLSAARPLSSVEAAAIARQRQAARRGQEPQRTEIPGGSSGTGWMVR